MIPQEAKSRKRSYILMPAVPREISADESAGSAVAVLDSDSEPALNVSMCFNEVAVAVAPATLVEETPTHVPASDAPDVPASDAPEMTDRAEVAQLPEPETTPDELPLEESQLETSPLDESALEDDLQDTESAEEPVTETVTAPAAVGPSLLTQLLFAVIPSGLGAVAAYFAAHQQSWDPPTWAALGGAVGFVLGWGSLLWIRRKD